MITQIKKIGNSLTIRLPSEFVKYMDLEVDNWVDISDINKVGKENETN